jgi:hypothetical protein
MPAHTTPSRAARDAYRDWSATCPDPAHPNYAMNEANLRAAVAAEEALDPQAQLDRAKFLDSIADRLDDPMKRSPSDSPEEIAAKQARLRADAAAHRAKAEALMAPQMAGAARWLT